jgi:hypothetical protein
MIKNATFLIFHLLDIQAFSNSETLVINKRNKSLNEIVKLEFLSCTYLCELGIISFKSIFMKI